MPSSTAREPFPAKVERWLENVKPRSFKNPDLLSPFTEWPSPQAMQRQPPGFARSSSPAKTSLRDNNTRTDARKSVTFVEPASLQSLTSLPRNPSLEPSSKHGETAHVDEPKLRAKPPSPVKPNTKQDVHIHLSLTDLQLSKLSNMFTTPQKRAAKESEKGRGTPTRQSSQASPDKKASSFDSLARRRYKKQDNDLAKARLHKKTESDVTQERGRPLRRHDFDFNFGSPAEQSPEYDDKQDGHRHSNTTNVTSFTNIIKHAARPATQGVSPSKTPTKSSTKSPRPHSADRKAKRRPTPLDLGDARKYGELAQHRKGFEAVHLPITPAEAELRYINEDGTSSAYTEDAHLDSAPTVSPLHVVKRASLSRNVNVLRAYNDWKGNSNGLGSPAEITGPVRTKSAHARREEATIVPDSAYQQVSHLNMSTEKGGLMRSATSTDLKTGSQTASTEPFTPLTPWIMENNGHGTRKASKKLIGDKGWLHDTAALESKVETHRTTGFLDSIRKVARDIVEMADLKNSRPRACSIARITISLDPREQSLLYCELEFVLSNVLDAYIKLQLNGARLDPDKLKKISDAWSQRGRPRVIGFRYDLETQLQLVGLHIQQFRFYGARQISEAAVAGLLDAMKSNARAMRVRTFCQPDSVIAKHILDAQALMQLLGSADSMQLAAAEVSQFFKVIVEREKAVRERQDREGRQHASSGPGAQDNWPVRSDAPFRTPAQSVGRRSEDFRA